MSALNQLLRVYIDGVPLDLASELLPWKTHLNFGLLTHIHLHAGAQKKYAGEEVKSRGGSMSKQAMTGLIESPDFDRQETGLETRRHGVGKLLRYYQLFRRRLRAQKTTCWGMDRAYQSGNGLGPGRQQWSLQPCGPAARRVTR